MSDDLFSISAGPDQVRCWHDYAAAVLNDRLGPSDEVMLAAERLHAAAVLSAAATIASGEETACALRQEALEFPVAGGRFGAALLGGGKRVVAEKAVLANAGAFGAGRVAGLIPVVYAASQIVAFDGDRLARALVLSTELASLDDARLPLDLAAAILFATIMECSGEQVTAAAALSRLYGSQPATRAATALAVESGVVAVRRAMRGLRLDPLVGRDELSETKWGSLKLPLRGDQFAACRLAAELDKTEPEGLAVNLDAESIRLRFAVLRGMSPEQIQTLYSIPLPR